MPYKDNKYSFIEKANFTHNNIYDYEKVLYVNSKTKVIILCRKHGEFLQKPNDHVLGHGCKFCYYDRTRKSITDFIVDAKNIHNDIYDYSKFFYNKNRNTKSIIVCKKHGDFKQNANAHLKGSGCPKCSESNGEKIIRKFLKINKIQFTYQKKFDNCKNINSLIFDFYIPNKKILIEYDGKHHYEPITFFGGEKTLTKIKINDSIKNNFAKKNNYCLVRIPYYDINNINNILNKKLNGIK